MAALSCLRAMRAACSAWRAATAACSSAAGSWMLSFTPPVVPAALHARGLLRARLPCWTEAPAALQLAAGRPTSAIAGCEPVRLGRRPSWGRRGCCTGRQRAGMASLSLWTVLGDALTVPEASQASRCLWPMTAGAGTGTRPHRGRGRPAPRLCRSCASLRDSPEVLVTLRVVVPLGPGRQSGCRLSFTGCGVRGAGGGMVRMLLHGSGSICRAPGERCGTRCLVRCQQVQALLPGAAAGVGGGGGGGGACSGR